MDISGTLHFYSGNRREFFFVFDDDVAQKLYKDNRFQINQKSTRRVHVSVGGDRFIHVRTLSFSKKQTEIKVSLTSKGSKEGLGRLTSLYDWFDSLGQHPEPFPILGTLSRVTHANARVWELSLIEGVSNVEPPGLKRRSKTPTRQRRSFETRRAIVERNLAEAGRPAEELAFEIVQGDYPTPRYSSMWRDGFLDSERIEIREMGVIADIDVWDVQNDALEQFIEVKAQKVVNMSAKPSFYLSVSEWRSFRDATGAGHNYSIWLFQYKALDDFENARHKIRLIVFEEIKEEWLSPNGYFVLPEEGVGTCYSITE